MAQTTRRIKTSSRQIDDIEVLSERLGSLQTINKASEESYEQSDKEISIILAPVIINNNGQATILKSMVLDPGWFNRDRMKFEDWQRGI